MTAYALLVSSTHSAPINVNSLILIKPPFTAIVRPSVDEGAAFNVAWHDSSQDLLHGSLRSLVPGLDRQETTGIVHSPETSAGNFRHPLRTFRKVATAHPSCLQKKPGFRAVARARACALFALHYYDQ